MKINLLFLLLWLILTCSIQGEPLYFVNDKGILQIRDKDSVLFSSQGLPWSIAGDTVYCLLSIGPPLSVVRFDAINRTTDTLFFIHKLAITHEHYYNGTALVQKKLAVARGGRFGCVYLPSDSGFFIYYFDPRRKGDSLKRLAKLLFDPDPLRVTDSSVAWIESAAFMKVCNIVESTQQTIGDYGKGFRGEALSNFLPADDGKFLIVNGTRLLRWHVGTIPKEVAHCGAPIHPAERLRQRMPFLFYSFDEQGGSVRASHLLEFREQDETMGSLLTLDSAMIENVSVDREGTIHCYYLQTDTGNRYETAMRSMATTWTTCRRSAGDVWVRIY